MEISQTMLAQARRRFRREINDGRLYLHSAPMDRLPLPDASVDAVVSTNTIYFVSELPAALAEVSRVLRPGGCLALGIGDPEAMSKMPFTKHGFILRPIVEVVEHLNQACFAAVENKRVGSDDNAFHVLVASTPVQHGPDRPNADPNDA